MGFDKSEPRNHSIFFWGIVSACTLVALIPVFHDYFASVTASRVGGDQNAPGSVREDIANQRASLDEGPMNIESAIDRLAAGGRNGSPVMPRANDGFGVPEEEAFGTLGAVDGWSGRPNEAAGEAAREAIRRARAGEQERLDAANAAAAAAATEGSDDVAPAPVVVRPVLRRPPAVREAPTGEAPPAQ